MPTHLLLTATAMAVTVAAALAAYGQHLAAQVHHGALRWWLAALVAVGSGAALAAAWTSAHWPASLLLLAWTPLMLVGLRRFHARIRLPGSARLDLGLLGLALMSVVLSVRVDPGLPVHAAAAAALVLGLYGAAVLVGTLGTAAAPTQRASGGPASAADQPAAAPVLALASAMAAAGLASALPSLAALATGPGSAGVAYGSSWLFSPAGALATQALAAALGAVATAFMLQWMLAERTERQLRASRRRLRALANQDALTQVSNRRHFRELASHALRHDDPGSAVLLIFDIDHFKHINDEQGHAAGDRALCLVSSCMVEHLRSADVAGRHGGDEFVLLLRQASTADAMHVAARIVAAIQQRSPALQLPVLTLSFGMVQVGLAEPLDEALRRADQALYEAKRQGRARAVAAQGDELEPVFGESRRLGLLPL